MCGITGLYAYGGGTVQREVLQQMTAVLAHRGPDADGCYIEPDGSLGLGHRRLSIIDLAGGAQPMSNGNGMVWIVFNGEIYNYRELRRELQQKGYHFRTNSDTETIIHLYDAEGPHGLDRLNGIFAFAIWDRQLRRLLLARDHFGVKPLYWCDTGRTLLFASELKSLLLHPEVERTVDIPALHTFLTLRYNPAPETLLRGIRKVRAGEMLLVDRRGLETKPYGKPEPPRHRSSPLSVLIDEYVHHLESAVERQMVSDVPIGVLLSGGVDSAILAYYMVKHAAGPVKSFSVGFEGRGDFNELDDAAGTARFVGTQHHSLVIRPNAYLDFLAKAIWHTEEPVGEPTVAAYFHVCKLAREHVKVVLTGQGADEPLAGYDRYYPERYRNLFSWLAARPIERLVQLFPRGQRLGWAARALRPSVPLDRFMEVYTLFSTEAQCRLCRPEILRTLGADLGEAPRRELKAIQDRANGLDGFSQLLYIDTRSNLPDNLLLFGDKLAMATSLEARVPYLDRDLIRFIESVPGQYKIRFFRRKFLHKQGLARVLPPQFLRRKKRGFPTPLRNWLRGPERRRFQALLTEPNSGINTFFIPTEVKRLFEEHLKGRDHARRIFTLANFELWYQRFILNREAVL